MSIEIDPREPEDIQNAIETLRNGWYAVRIISPEVDLPAAWDELVSDKLGDLPKWADLTTEQRDYIVEYAIDTDSWEQLQLPREQDFATLRDALEEAAIECRDNEVFDD